MFGGGVRSVCGVLSPCCDRRESAWQGAHRRLFLVSERGLVVGCRKLCKSKEAIWFLRFLAQLRLSISGVHFEQLGSVGHRPEAYLSQRLSTLLRRLSSLATRFDGQADSCKISAGKSKALWQVGTTKRLDKKATQRKSLPRIPLVGRNARYAPWQTPFLAELMGYAHLGIDMVCK